MLENLMKYENILKLIDEAIREKNALIDGYRIMNKELKEENEKLRFLLEEVTKEQEATENESR